MKRERVEEISDEQLDFLIYRKGADDSDVEALQTRFNLSEKDATHVYCAFLDSCLYRGYRDSRGLFV